MHIVHILTRLLRGGSEENTAATCLWQVAAGHRVTLIHGCDAHSGWRAELPGVEIVARPEMVHAIRPADDLRALAALRRTLKALAPDVVHTHQSKAGLLGRMAASAAPGARVVHGLHIAPAGGGRVPSLVLGAAERAAARRTDLFIAVSDAVGAAYVDAGICPRDRVRCVPSGMDLDRFRHGRPPADLARLLGVRPGRPVPKVALMLASFEPRKRHVAFLHAFARALGPRRDVRLLLAGRGPEEARARAAVRDLGLEGRVVFCEHRTDPEALLAAADVSVLASAREGLPRVAVQSMAAGCPMVACALPGLDEIVHDGTSGRLVPPDDLNAAARETLALLDADARRAVLRRGAAATDVSAWTIETLGARTTALYEAAA
ncbi:glycosyltransferase [Tranquillimonas alkanivorans]|uniref:Glycosyltransferase involved in cell wall bisynthesis n=1 Tax=Tranquillimonas alkanivorans TaxID=441119 RepID=A0A1I5L8Y2_9RHOB|nr:glycosyltransferase [Tranquillimonas alkanivorans]SFO93653.1 Glycosyltransferase involved in cell wall bisynthesis [Tranquillimonas alkanivorans]